eukprot:1001593_1
MFSILSILAISVVNAENYYKAFTTIKLPKNLMQPITAVYNDNLFVFGGINSTDGAYNTKFWKLPLKDAFSLDTTNNPPTDITTTLINSNWEELNVTAPSYGDSQNKEFICAGQCSVVIDQYLYIVGPYSSSSSSTTATRTNIYRLDLGVNTPIFASTTEFAYQIGYTSNARDQCVTSADGKMYIMTGVGSAPSRETKVYDPSSPTTPLVSLQQLSSKSPRFLAGCASNVDGDKIYLAGGSAPDIPNLSMAPGIDTYDITDNTWTDNAETNEFDTSDNIPSFSRRQMKCFTNYKESFECPGGFGSAVKTDSIIWNYNTRGETYVNLEIDVFMAGVSVYEFYATGDYRGSIVLVIGGSSDGSIGVDTIQYSLRYALITSPPTTTPSTSPTTTAPSELPTQQPSQSPLCNGCTRGPTMSPVPTMTPVDNGQDDGQDDDAQDGSSDAIIISSFWVGILLVMSVLY